MIRCVPFLLFVVAVVAANQEDQTTTTEEVHQDSGLTSLQLPQEFALSDTFVRAVGTAGAIVTGVAGIAVLFSLVLPVFGLRTCMFFGTCEEPTYDPVAYSQNVAANSVYDQPGYPGYQYSTNTYKKRSLEYVGPILKALSAAYDKYGPKQPMNQNVHTARSSTSRK